MGDLERGNLERATKGDLEPKFESVSEVCRADLEVVTNLDGMESRGSVSPKSLREAGNQASPTVASMSTQTSHPASLILLLLLASPGRMDGCGPRRGRT